MKINKLKKGDLSINMVIVAAIAMVVLLVVVLIFTGKFRAFGQSMESCGNLGGECVETTNAAASILTQKNSCAVARGGDAGDYIVHTNTDCNEKEPPEICCQRIT
ncbi:hypothetical protein C0585_04600 [Candidatus Woesearchaeota archaeon]|nr:MAG: hypothetical protein C0585_04600 [Candidatus Woesearchaeota archaeon]